jgi:putative cell wall-binding protein
MIDINCDRLHVKIDLPNGIYSMGTTSASGKTYMAKLLSEVTSRRDIICISYNNYLYIDSLVNLADKLNATVIILDRYDMYCDAFKDDIVQLKDKLIVLIDSKHGTSFDEFVEVCFIDFNKTCLEVTC